LPGANLSSSLQSYNIITKELKTNLAPPLGTGFYSSLAMNRFVDNPEIILFQNHDNNKLYVCDIVSGNIDEIDALAKFRNLDFTSNNDIYGLAENHKIFKIILE
jgi:hypothetical protein